MTRSNKNKELVKSVPGMVLHGHLKQLFCRIFEGLNRPSASAPAAEYSGVVASHDSTHVLSGSDTTAGIGRALGDAVENSRLTQLLIDEAKHLGNDPNVSWVAEDQCRQQEAL